MKMRIKDRIKLSGVSYSGMIVTFTIRREPRRGHKKYRITWTQAKGDYREAWAESLDEAKGFPSRWEEAEKLKNGSKSFCTRLTWLNEDQLREAESCILRLPTPMKLDEAISFSIKHMPKGKNALIKSAWNEYIDVQKKTQKTANNLKTKRRIAKFITDYGYHKLIDITASDIEPYVYNDKQKPSTQNGNLRVFNAFFNWCVKKSYLGINPANGLEKVKEVISRPEILSLEEAKNLLSVSISYKEGITLPYLIATMLLGMRNCEVRSTKESVPLSWDSIKLEEGVILLNASAKTNQCRNIKIRPEMANVISLLKNVEGMSFDPKNFRRHFDEVKKLAKIKRWTNNILRHTASSYLYALTHDDQFVINNLGHCLSVNKKHYQHLITPDEGIAFYRLGLKPEGENSLKVAV